MSLSRRLLAVLLPWAFAAAPGLADHELSRDPRLVTGQLANGTTWIYRQHGTPKGRMALMMHVRTGSLNEAEHERGLAHFIEHMVFNGTDHFPPGTLVPYFESIGMEFGPDLNASTSFDRTAYKLFLPDTSPEQIDKALILLSDFAFRAQFSTEEIDHERPIILEEARSRKSAALRLNEQLWPQLFPGTRFAERMPIGTEQVIRTATREDFISYYRTWYRPENVTLIVVGDAELNAILPVMERHFGEYRPDVPVQKAAGSGFDRFTVQRAIVLTDPDLTTGRVELFKLLPGRPPATTIERWRSRLIESMADQSFQYRCRELIEGGAASFQRAATDVDDFFHEAVGVWAWATGEPNDWHLMLEMLVVEVRRVREYGFSGREIERTKREIVTRAERAARVEPTREARSVVNDIFNAVNDGVPVLSAQQEVDLLNDLLPEIGVVEVNRSFRRSFAPGTFTYVVTLPENVDAAKPDSDTVLAAARSAWTLPVEPVREEDRPDMLLADLPEPGEIVEAEKDPELGVTSCRLSNGACVRHLHMTDKRDQVYVSISFGGGGIEETAENIGISTAAMLVADKPATSRLDGNAVRDLMVGRNMKVQGASSGDAMAILLSGSPSDLEFGFQLAYALATDGRLEAGTFRNWMLETLRQVGSRDKDVRYGAADAMGDVLGGGDPRLLALQRQNVESLTLERVQAWIERVFREGPIEVAVVGDITWEHAKPLVERYIGSLPDRSAAVDQLEALRRVARQEGPHVRRVEVESASPAAVAYAGCVGCNGRDAEHRRALELAESILSSRLIARVREELGLVYGIGASSDPAWVFLDAGRFYGGGKCEPDKAERVAEEIHGVFRQFAESGPSEQELEAARLQVLNKLDTNVKDPRYWLSVLRHLSLRGRDLSEVHDLRASYTRLAADDVRKAFHSYYIPSRKFTVIAVPTTPELGAVGVAPEPASASQPDS